MPDNHSQQEPGTLYVVATPIGNLQDITLRALETLGRANLIAAEDTRHTRKLLAAHGIENKLVSYHEHNERQRTADLIEKLQAGQSIALVTDAGTPAVSDPGYRLVAEAIGLHIPVVPIPGVSAAISALSVAGLPTDRFTFVGFPLRKKSRRLAQLEELAGLPHTLIFYQSPRRLVSFLREVLSVMGDRAAVLAREQTKIHEEFIRVPLTKMIQILDDRESVKGECTLLVSAAEATGPSEADIESALIAALAAPDRPMSQIAKTLAKQFGLNRNTIYNKAMQLKKATALQPVIMPVPAAHRQLRGREMVAALRHHARNALAHSARFSRMTLGALKKDGNGAPLPSNGVYWSLSHKRAYVAAVVAPHPVGIDIEALRPTSAGLRRRIASADEWALAPEVSDTLFFRYWTAKEAVLKAVGRGLAALESCRIHKIVDDTHIEVSYDGAVWHIVQHWTEDNHIVAVTAANDDIEWHLIAPDTHQG